jgi:hypothetical protein
MRFLGSQSNALPWAICYSDGVSTLIDRLYRPIISAPGRYPRWSLELATAEPADGPRLYGAKPIHTFFKADAQPTLDPVVRARLRTLINGCGVLRDELRRRNRMQMAPIEPTPSKRVENLDLIRATFGKPLTYNEMGEAAE